jgi:type IV fimbrial biogenesis protein FimT
MKPIAVRERGFTIIEVMVGIGIIAFLLFVGVPSSQRWLQNQQMRNAAESALNGMKQARLEALRRNTSVAFELQDPNSTAWHVCLFDTAAGTCQAGQPDIFAKPASEGTPQARFGVESPYTDFGTALTPGMGVPAMVAFDPLGRVSTVPVASPIARMDVRNPTAAAADERRLSIFVGPGGQIYMCDPALSKAANPQGCQ